MLGIFRLLQAIAFHVYRRGHGLLKILFVVDDFIRVFTMTILFIIFLTQLNMPRLIIFLGGMLGLVIDIQDFISDNELAKFFD